jgi:hypothetical protein
MLSLENLTLVNNAQMDNLADGGDLNIPNSSASDPLGTIDQGGMPTYQGSYPSPAPPTPVTPTPKAVVEYPVDTMPVEPAPVPPVAPIVVDPIMTPVEPVAPVAPIVVEPVPIDVTPAPAQAPAPAKKCYNYSVTNVTDYNVGFSYTDCCTGENVQLQVAPKATYDNIRYEVIVSDYGNDLQVTNLVPITVCDGTKANPILVAPIIPNSHPTDPLGTTTTQPVANVTPAPAPAPAPAPVVTSTAPTPEVKTTSTPIPTTTTTPAVAPVGKNLNYLVIGLGAVLVVLIAGKLMSPSK